MQRIILKDKQNNPFRICSFELLTDHKKEEYMKFSFPDLKNTPALLNDTTEEESKDEKLIIEFSTHFQHGVSHFKTSNQKYFHRNESKSNFMNSELIHLLDFIIYDLNHFKEFTKKLSKLDYSLENHFDDNKGKVYMFYLSKTNNKIKLPAINYTDLDWKAFYPFTFQDKYRMLIVEYEFQKLDKEKTGVSLFRKHEQKEEFIEVEIPKQK